jgi:DNA processing protein
MEVSVSTLTSVVDRPAAEQALHWLALGLTPGLGPSRARRLVEHFGSIAAVFRASLTELEATGLLAVSAQSLGTGKSLELAQEELAKAVSAGVAILAFDDPAYPARLKEIYDPPLVLYVRGNVNVLALPHRRSWHAPSHALWFGHGRAAGHRSRGSRPGNP